MKGDAEDALEAFTALGGSCPNPNCVPCNECGSTVPMRSDYTAPDPRADGPPK